MAIIKINNFSKIYKKKTIAVNNLTLEVEKGSFFGFVGPNGAGKTTTVNFVAGLIKKNSGELNVFGEKITDNSFKYKAKIGFVLEKPLYFEKLTAKEYLQFVGYMQNLNKKTVVARTDELLEFLELSEKKDKLIETYSAGMKKKVSFAAAIIHDPALLILDEPFEGIDPISSKTIKDNLKTMIAKGKTVFLTSHILEIVEKLCDEVAIINKGELVFKGHTDSIRKKLKDSTTGQTYSGLEELFQHLVAPEEKIRTLSWLE